MGDDENKEAIKKALSCVSGASAGALRGVWTGNPYSIAIGGGIGCYAGVEAYNNKEEIRQQLNLPLPPEGDKKGLITK